jgi:hypothetical protein
MPKQRHHNPLPAARIAANQRLREREEARRLARRTAKKAANTARMARRAARMMALYRTGKTLREIGRLHRLTRERVRQILHAASRHSAAAGQPQPHFVADAVNRRRAAQADARYAEFRRQLRRHLFPDLAVRAMGLATYQDLTRRLRREHPAEYAAVRRRVIQRGMDRFRTHLPPPEHFAALRAAGVYKRAAAKRRKFYDSPAWRARFLQNMERGKKQARAQKARAKRK